MAVRDRLLELEYSDVKYKFNKKKYYKLKIIKSYLMNLIIVYIHICRKEVLKHYLR